MERAWNGLLCEEEAFLKAEYLLFFPRCFIYFIFYFYCLPHRVGDGGVRGSWSGSGGGGGWGGAPSSQTTVRVHASLTRDSFVHREYCVRDYVKYLAKRAGITEQSTGK